MDVNRVTLAFTGKDRYLEPLFLKQYNLNRIVFWRICMGISIVAYGSVGIMEAWIFPGLRNILWTIRYLVVIPFFLVALGISWHSVYQRACQLINFTLILVTGLGAIAMVMLTPAPLDHIVYFDVLIVCLFFGFALIRTRFVVATAAAGVLCLCYGDVLFSVDKAPRVIQVNNFFFLVITLMVGMFIAYCMELAERRTFFLSHHLEETNQNLEKRVEQRTEELSKANIALSEQIEERKREESHRLRLEKRLRQSQKMDAIGTLAGGIAHDFNNILGIITGYGEMMEMSLPSQSPQAREYIHEILKAGRRGADLVRQILSFSRQDEQELMPVKISAVVKEATKLIRATFPTSIQITSRTDSESYVMADPTQIHQIIVNLFNNARHALGDRPGDITVTLTDRDLDDTDIRMLNSSLKPGRYIKLTVSDTGCGMSPEVRERIFEPFFTTKKQGEGTGLGLSVVHGIVKYHRGAITVYSEPGAGSTFNVLLPVTDRTHGDESGRSDAWARGSERILYVDDEAALVSMMQRSLENMGYIVRGVADSEEAWEIFKCDPDRFDLVVSDLTMPHMTGLQLAEKILALRSGFPFILCTGFGQRKYEDEARKIGVHALLNKPVSAAELSRVIRKVFNNRKTAVKNPEGEATG